MRYLYGDRNRWTKLATLLSHMGLILFLIAGVVTWRFGDEQGLVVGEGDTLTVQPIGTPGLLLVKNYRFEAPGFLETGQASDFTTDLGVFQNGHGDRAQDDPGERPAGRRRLYVPRERVRGGPGAADQRCGRQAAVGRAGAADRPGGRPAIRNPVRAGSRHRPASSCSSASPTERASSWCCRTG